MERPIGPEALRELPFRDVVLGFDDAVDVLCARASIVLDANIDKIFEENNSVFPTLGACEDEVERVKGAAGEYRTGRGLAVSRNELKSIYDEGCVLTYNQVVEHVVSQVFSRCLVKDQKRIAGAACIGYCLDLVSIVNPQIADFEDAVQIIVDNVKKTQGKYKWFFLGTFIDDCIKNATNPQFDFDYLIDIENTLKFRDTLLKLLPAKEKAKFMRAFDTTSGVLN